MQSTKIPNRNHTNTNKGSVFARLVKTFSSKTKSTTVKQLDTSLMLKTFEFTLSPLEADNNSKNNWYLISRSQSIVDAGEHILEMKDSRRESILSTESFEDPATINLNNFPIELICKIISYLDFNDKKNASQVCKRWRFAFFTSNFLSHALVKANNNLFVSYRPHSPQTWGSKIHRSASTMAIQSFKLTFNFNFYTHLVNLDFENDSADVDLMLNNLRSSTQLESALLPRLKFLRFVKTTMSSRVLIDFLKESPNLETLHVIQCDSLFMSGFLTINISNQDEHLSLKKLRHLSLSRNRYLTDSLLNFFANSTLNLESLDISNCTLTKKNYKSIQNQQIDLNSSSVVLTVENLIEIVSKKIGKTLKCLNLNFVEIFNHDDESLLSLLGHAIHLEHLNLAGLITLKVDTCVRAIEKLKNLKSIDLNGSIQDMNQKPVEYLFVEAFNNLEEIKLNKAKINDPELFKLSIVKCAQLVHLDLSFCFFLRSFGTLSRVNEFIEQLAHNFAQLELLETFLLSGCDFIVTDRFVKIVAKKLNKLKKLDLRNCSKITDKSVHYISHYLLNLVHLDLSWCQNLSDYGLNNTIEYSRDKQLLNELNKDLNIYLKKYAEQPFLLIKQKAQIANESKKSLNKNEESFEEDNKHVEDHSELVAQDEFKHKTVSLRNLKFLKTLKLESCINISDVGLYKGIDLSQLVELDIKLCTGINGDFIYSKFDEHTTKMENVKLFNNLKILNVNQCVNFKMESLMFIVNNAPFLRELSISALPNIDNQFIKHLTNSKKLLSLFDISFCANINESFVEAYEQFLYNEFGSREFILDKRFISK